MTTPAQIRANRQNALKSTGPRTPQGKSAVSKNALTHGLTANKLTIPGEDTDHFNAHRTQIRTELAPVGPLESLLTDRISILSWRLTRINRIQSAAIHSLADKTEAESKTLLGQFLSPKKSKPSSLKSQASGLDDSDILGDLAIKDFSKTRILERLLMYERRLENSLYKTHLEFQKTQLLRLRKQAITQETPKNA